ncbi:hypothetical protein LLG96_13925, partial [bacterium]|nr:hypothetical protein [bacterium]
MSEKVFAFDIGTGSLGIAVREGKEIIEARSLLIHPEFASTKEQRERRRQHRTRIAHKSREQFLKEQCRKAGIEVLEGRKPGNKKKGIPPRKGDPRLETEFAPAGDNTVYTSCLLRIMLLQGERLEGWQVYKALHSAIQRRGYDPDILWKSGEKQSKKDDEKETLKNMNEYKSELEKIAGGKNGYTYPCYYDAKKMGLWDAVNGIKNLSPTHESLRARGYTAPRTLVEKEVRALLNAASRLYPGLGGKADYILYGPAGKPYASYNPDIRKQYGLREGSISEWQGVLRQK